VKPDLRASNINSLEFSTSCNIPDDIRDTIKKSSKSEDGVYRFTDVYTIGRSSYQFLLSISLSKAKKEASFVEFEIIKRSKKRALKGLPNASLILDKLCSLNTTHKFFCSTDIQYKKKDKRSFIINLPLKISRAELFPVSEINGFSLEGNVGGLEYSALLWTAKNGVFFATFVVFKEYTINESIAENIVDDFATIANSLFIGR
jgi:hypothetical protein